MKHKNSSSVWLFLLIWFVLIAVSLAGCMTGGMASDIQAGATGSPIVMPPTGQSTSVPSVLPSVASSPSAASSPSVRPSVVQSPSTRPSVVQSPSTRPSVVSSPSARTTGVASPGTTQSPGVLPPSAPSAQAPFDSTINQNAQTLFAQGRDIFRNDTFGDEAYWGGLLQLHNAIQGQQAGGVGNGLSPKAALGLGLKVDMDVLPASLVNDLKANKVNLDDPATTLALLKLNAVVGVKGFFDNQGHLTSVGITCAFCHSTVDNAFTTGIGHRLDGWPNQDLNVGAIVALAPNLQPVADRLHVDVNTLKQVLNSWGPGMYDAEVNQDGKAMRPDGKSAATKIPPAYGLAGVNLHTWTGWGSVPYWNAYVAITQMHGNGTFFDPRLNNQAKFPLAVENGDFNIQGNPDMVSSKLPALHFYQLSIPAPDPPAGSFDQQAASRGDELFDGKAKCGTCHVDPTKVEPGWPMHTGQEIGIDDFQSSRSPDGMYRTAPLRGIWSRQARGFFHDGRFATLLDVVNHYDTTFNLGLSDQEKSDLVEYLKSLGSIQQEQQQ